MDSLKIGGAIFLGLFVASCLTSCSTSEDVEAIPNSGCTTKVRYKGTNVCFDGEQAAAVQIVENEEYLILENFFDFYQSGNIGYDEILHIGYEPVDFNIKPPFC
jgi:hypothetical protein